MTPAHYILLGYYFGQTKDKLENLSAMKQLHKLVTEGREEKESTSVISRLKELLS